MGWVMACKQRARGPGWRRGRSIVAPHVHVVVVCVVGTERERERDEACYQQSGCAFEIASEPCRLVLGGDTLVKFGLRPLALS